METLAEGVREEHKLTVARLVGDRDGLEEEVGLASELKDRLGEWDEEALPLALPHAVAVKAVLGVGERVVLAVAEEDFEARDVAVGAALLLFRAEGVALSVVAEESLALSVALGLESVAPVLAVAFGLTDCDRDVRDVSVTESGGEREGEGRGVFDTDMEGEVVPRADWHIEGAAVEVVE